MLMVHFKGGYNVDTNQFWSFVASYMPKTIALTRITTTEEQVDTKVRHFIDYDAFMCMRGHTNDAAVDIVHDDDNHK